jgi:hypothetical protein
MRVIRLIQQWLTAGVLAAGGTPREEGVPQGGLRSPVLANISRHEACALWGHAWRKRNAPGEVLVVRDADDLGLGFEHRAEAVPCQGELRARLATFDLTLHADTTHLLEFGRVAVRNCGRRGPGQPATVDVLGFTHLGGQAAQDRCIVRRQTLQKRRRATRQEITTALRRRLHDPMPQQGRWRRAVLRGHYRY